MMRPITLQRRHRRGLLRLWIAISLPWIGYWGYEGITAHKLEQGWQELADRNHSKRMELLEEFERTKAPWIKDALASNQGLLDSALDGRNAAYDRVERAVTFGPTLPIGMIVIYLVGGWVARGFREKQDA